MLILGRRVGQVILIGDNIKIVVTRIGNDSVGIGIDAPKEIKILREEISPNNLPKEDQCAS